MKNLPKHNRNSEMPSQLYDLLTSDADKERAQKYFNVPATKAVRVLICEYLENKHDLSVRKSDSPEKYALPAWSEYQADQIGYRRALKEILELLNR